MRAPTTLPPPIAALLASLIGARASTEVPDATPTQPGTPKLTISPDVSIYLLLAQSTVTCTRDVIDGNEGINVIQRCPRSCPPSEIKQKRNGSESIYTTTFIANTSWDGVTISCSLSGYPNISVSKTIRVLGNESVQMIPNVLVFVEHSEVTVRCTLVGSEAIERAAAFDIDMSMKCSGDCPTHGTTLQSDTPAAKTISFIATRQWQSAQVSCYSRNYPAYSIAETVTILAPPGELKIYSDKPLFLSGHAAHAYCAMDTSGATTELLFRVLECDACTYLTNHSLHDGVTTIAFLPDGSWNGTQLLCYKSLDESSNVTSTVIVHDEPNLSFSPDQGEMFYDVENTLTCRGDGVASRLGLEWNVMCASSCPTYSERKDDDAGETSLTFSASRLWNDATVTCSLRQFPSVMRGRQLAFVDAPEIKIFPKDELFKLESVVLLFCVASTTIKAADLKWVTYCTSCTDQPVQYVTERDGEAVLVLKFTAVSSWHNVTAKCYSVDYPSLENATTILIREFVTADENPLLYVAIGFVVGEVITIAALTAALLKQSPMPARAPGSDLPPRRQK